MDKEAKKYFKNLFGHLADCEGKTLLDYLLLRSIRLQQIHRHLGEENYQKLLLEIENDRLLKQKNTIAHNLEDVKYPAREQAEIQARLNDLNTPVYPRLAKHSEQAMSKKEARKWQEKWDKLNSK